MLNILLFPLRALGYLVGCIFSVIIIIMYLFIKGFKYVFSMCEPGFEDSMALADNIVNKWRDYERSK